MRHLPAGAFRSHYLYLDTGSDLTGRGDLPIFPATSAVNSAVNRPADSVKTRGLS